MWRATLFANALLMYIFWLSGLIAITPAYHHFARYGQDGGRLPLPTSMAISVRLIMVVIPMAWTILSYFIFKLVKNKRIEQRVETLLAFTVITLVIGLFILLFFTLSGMLPFLNIGMLPE